MVALLIDANGTVIVINSVSVLVDDNENFKLLNVCAHTFSYTWYIQL